MWRMLQNAVNQPELLRFFGVKEVIAFHFGHKNVERLLGVFHVDLRQLFLDFENLFSLDLNVGGLTAGTAARLMDHDSRVRKGMAHSWLAGSEKQRSH